MLVALVACISQRGEIAVIARRECGSAYTCLNARVTTLMVCIGKTDDGLLQWCQHDLNSVGSAALRCVQLLYIGTMPLACSKSPGTTTLFTMPHGMAILFLLPL